MFLTIEEQQGCLDIWIDDIVPCLKETVTGDLKETVVLKIQSRSYLKDFNSKNGWRINWSKVPKDVEVYALAICGSNEIQGLIGVKNDPNAKAAYIHWACTAPQNNKHDFGSQKYEGVGGHLIAIAVEKSLEWGYEGVVYGYALNSLRLRPEYGAGKALCRKVQCRTFESFASLSCCHWC